MKNEFASNAFGGGGGLTLTAADARYARLGAANVFTAANEFQAGISTHLGNNNGVIIGMGAGGTYAANNSDQIAIGFFAGAASTASGSAQSVRVGRHAGYAAVGANQFCGGHAAGQYAYDSDNAVIIGYLAGRNVNQVVGQHSFSSVLIGHEAGTNATSAQTSVILGPQAGRDVTTAVAAVILGSSAGRNATYADGAVIIGNTAGYNATNSLGSVLIGPRAGYSLNRSYSLVIEGNATYSDAGNTALIYGEFDNRTLTFNGTSTFTAKETVSFGIAAATQGDGIQIKNTTAATSGNQTWSPSLRLTGNQWASGASRTCEWLATVVPVQQDYDHSTLRFQTKHGSNALVNVLDIRNFNGAPMIESGSAITIGGTGGNTPLNIQYNGANIAGWYGTALYLGKDVAMNWTNGSTISGSVDAIFGRKAAATFQFGADAAGVTNQQITAASRITSDGVGANLTLSAGNGRGAAGGSLIFSTYDTQGAGTIGNLQTRMTIDTTGLVTIASGGVLQLGNAATTGLMAGVLAALTNATVTLKDSTGQLYRIPCII